MSEPTRKQNSTAQRLLCNAFINQACEKGGMEELSVTGICKEAGVNRGTFYRYYSCMDEMRDRVVGWLSRQLSETIPCVVKCVATNDMSTAFSEVTEKILKGLSAWPNYAVLLQKLDNWNFYSGISNCYAEEMNRVADEFGLTGKDRTLFELQMFEVGIAYYSAIIYWYANMQNAGFSVEEMTQIILRGSVTIAEE